MIETLSLNKFTTDDQKFYDTQVNEELKYCACINYIMEFIKINKDQRAILIKTKENKVYSLVFWKRDYEGINNTLATLRLNIALAEKEKNVGSSEYKYPQINTVATNQSKKDIITLSGLDELLIDNKPLRKKEDVINELLKYAMHTSDGEPYLDFYEAGYDKGIQNYLILNLYDENISINEKLIDALFCYKKKEPRIYYLINSFMRGNFNEFFRYNETINQKFSIERTIELCQSIIQAQEKLPKRKYNLMLYRVGLDINKNKNIGSENKYENFVSFGTSGGTFTGKETEKCKNQVIYRRILKKDDKAIPVDLIENLGIMYLDRTQENEFLLPPFVFKITSIEQKQNFDIFDIEKTKKINSRQLLVQRVNELEKYLKLNNKIDDYKKLKQIRYKILQKSIKNNKDYNIKDIYFGLRP